MSAPPWRVALAALLLVVLAAAVTAEPEARRTYLVLATAQDRGTDLSDALLDLSKDLRAQGRDDLQQEAARRRLWLIIPIVLILAPMCRLGLDPVGRSVESGLSMGRVVRGISDVSLELPWGVSRSTITSRSEKGVVMSVRRSGSVLVSVAIVAVVSLVLSGVAFAAPSATCDGLAATIVGTNGSDELIGTPGPDVIVGLNGDDFILGLGGDDVICGGNGADEIFGDDFGDPAEGFPAVTGDDRIFGGNGDDFLVGMRGADLIHGDNGNDIVIGGPEDDSLFGDNGDDLIFGTFGNDSLFGGRGDDFLNGDLPFPVGDDGSTPPGAFEDPTPGNSDTCDGGLGTDAETFCELQTSIENHPDPSTVIFDV